MKILRLSPTYNINCFIMGFTGTAKMQYKKEKIIFSFSSLFYDNYQHKKELTPNKIKLGYSKRLDFIGYKRTNSNRLNNLLEYKNLKPIYKNLAKLVNKEKHKIDIFTAHIKEISKAS